MFTNCATSIPDKIPGVSRITHLEQSAHPSGRSRAYTFLGRSVRKMVLPPVLERTVTLTCLHFESLRCDVLHRRQRRCNIVTTTSVR